MESNPLVSVIILNWNRLNETIRAIESVKNQSYRNIEIILVDNGSTELKTDETFLNIKEIEYIKLDKNYGCPGGRNRGISHCNGEFIFFCDNDGVLHENAVENALHCINKNEKIGIVAGQVIAFISENEIDTRLLTIDANIFETNLFQGTISMHRKSVLNITGYYPDNYIYGGEETYLSLKTLDAGYSIIKCENVIIWHKKSIFARDNKKELIQAWHNVFITAYQLFPIEYFIIFALYYFIVYPIYAIKYGVFRQMKFLFHLPSELSSYTRKPVKRRTYWKYRKLR